MNNEQRREHARARIYEAARELKNTGDRAIAKQIIVVLKQSELKEQTDEAL